ncbi:MAG: hydrolase [Chloracidobacterium sp.]|nr:hydrolase [Chloracidobacterium sp.]
MPHPNLLQQQNAALIVVDIQEGFRPIIADFDKIAERAARMIRGCRLLDVPVFVTEHYPKGLGNTAAEIKSLFDDIAGVFEKTAFSSCGAESLVAGLTDKGIKQVMICGLETHICVNQTAHDLLDRGFQVHVLSDCVTSRFEYNRLAGLAKMQRSGAIESSIEMALFELMRDAKHEKFKEIQALIK